MVEAANPLCQNCGHPVLDPLACYCTGCGCRLGHLVILSSSGECSIAEGVGRCWVELKNQGVGAVRVGVRHEYQGAIHRCETGAPVEPMPDGEPTYVLAPDATERLDFVVPGQAISGRVQTTVYLRVWDEDGTGSTYNRGYHAPKPRTLPHSWINRWPEPGRLDCPQELVVFPRRHRKAYIRLRNLGQLSLTVTIGPLPQNFGFTTDHEVVSGVHTPIPGLSPDERTLETVVPGGEEQRVTLLAPPLQETWHDSDARIRLRASDGQQHVIRMFREPILPGFHEEVAWIMGVDFGTHESRVYATPGFRAAARRVPRVIVRRPSTMGFSVGRPDDPACGISHERLRSYTDAVDGMKLLLNKGESLSLVGRMWTPRELVVRFLRYLKALAEESPEFDEPNVFDVSHSCLAVPALETLTKRSLQADETRAAAIEGGFPDHGTSIHLEPDCAALDFIHQRRTSAYEDFDPQHGDYICIFDCGAGTTDISILRYLVGNNGQDAPRAGDAQDEVHLQFIGVTGCELFAGNMIDRLLANAVLEKLERSPGFKKPPASQLKDLLAMKKREFEKLEDEFVLEGEEDSRLVRDMPDAVRVSKEQLYQYIRTRPTPEEMRKARLESSLVWPSPSQPGDAIRVEIPRQQIDEILAPWLEMILETGIHPRTGQHAMTSLSELLAEKGLERRDVHWACLTGGSSIMIPVAQAVYDFFKPESGGARRFKLITPPLNEIRDNVARGAALRHQYRIEGRLPCDVYATVTPLVAENAPASMTRELLRAGVTDGAEQSARPIALDYGYAVLVALGVRYPNGAAGDVFRHTLLLSGGQPNRVLMKVTYRDSRVFLELKAGPEGQPEPPAWVDEVLTV